MELQEETKNEMPNYSAAEVIENDEDDNLFEGEYEEFVEKSFYADVNYEYIPNVVTSKVKQNRELYRIILVKPRKEFEGPVTFSDKIANDESTGSVYEAKPLSTKDFLMGEKIVLEMGFQTANSNKVKSYQVQKVKTKNVFTQIEEDMSDIKPKFEQKSSIYLSNLNKIKDIDNFILNVRNEMEKALQSNETIDIFQNDFDLDRKATIMEVKDKDKEKITSDIRTFRESTLAGQKTKKFKCINHVRMVRSDEVYIAHTLLRNLNFEERIRTIGIPAASQILFWNFKDTEISSHVWQLDLPMELTCFEFNPTNCNQVVCGMMSGQIIIYEFTDLLGILKRSENENKKVGKKEQFLTFTTAIIDSHKTHITDIKWFPKGYYYTKYTLNHTNNNEHKALATIAEDGQVILWSIEKLEKNSKIELILRAANKIEINKVDTIAKIYGTGLELKVSLDDPILYVSTDEGQVYGVDWYTKVTSDHLFSNIKKVFSGRYYRPVIYFEFSPFYDDIFLTLHDYHFCIWVTSRTKPIFVSPNLLKKGFYTCAKFSPSRPSVIYLTKHNGHIDIWDFNDESHKPSVRETIINETITFLEIIKYSPSSEDEYGNKKNIYTEYFAIGDVSGQLTLMEVPKLFSEMKTPDEKQIMYKFLMNELMRQEHMEIRYKILDEEFFKQDDGSSERNDSNDSEMKNMEQNFVNLKNKLLEDLGLAIIELGKTEDQGH